MHKILICDFDGTLYDGDIFRECCFKVKNPIFLIFAIMIMILNKAGIVSIAILKFYFCRYVESSLLAQLPDHWFTEHVKNKFNQRCLDLINDYDTVIILTASPERIVSKAVHYQVFGTHINDAGELVHFYGVHKKDFIKEFKKNNEHDYCVFDFVGDSDSDLLVLDEVDNYYRVGLDGEITCLKETFSR